MSKNHDAPIKKRPCNQTVQPWFPSHHSTRLLPLPFGSMCKCVVGNHHLLVHLFHLPHGACGAQGSTSFWCMWYRMLDSLPMMHHPHCTVYLPPHSILSRSLIIRENPSRHQDTVELLFLSGVVRKMEGEATYQHCISTSLKWTHEHQKNVPASFWCFTPTR